MQPSGSGRVLFPGNWRGRCPSLFQTDSVSQAAPAPLASRRQTPIRPEKAHCLCYHCRDMTSSPFVQGTWEAMKRASSAGCAQGAVGMGTRGSTHALPPGTLHLIACFMWDCGPGEVTSSDFSNLRDFLIFKCTRPNR